MRKLIFILMFVPFMLSGQTPDPLVDLSEYHNDNRIKEMTDLNFTNITEGGYTLPLLKADSIDVRALSTDYATIPILRGNTQSLGMIRVADVWHVFGGFQDSTVEISITEDEWAVVTNTAGDLWTGISADGFSMSGDTMIITNAGCYMGSFSVTFTVTNSNVVIFRVYNVTQAVAEGFTIGATGDGAADYVTVTKPLLFHDIAAGDRLVMQCTNTDASNNITVRFGAYFVTYLHDQ